MAAKCKDGLFLGDMQSSQDLEFVVANKISRIINCSGREVPNGWERGGVRYLTYYWPESGNCVIFDETNSVLDEIYAFIEDAIESGESVLVHSTDGVSRACFCVAVYFMLKYRWTLSKTLTFLRNKRPDLHPKPGFMRQLQALDHSLQRMNGKNPIDSKRANEWIVEDSRPSSASSGISVVSVAGETLEEEKLLSNTFLNSQPALEEIVIAAQSSSWLPREPAGGFIKSNIARIVKVEGNDGRNNAVRSAPSQRSIVWVDDPKRTGYSSTAFKTPTVGPTPLGNITSSSTNASRGGTGFDQNSGPSRPVSAVRGSVNQPRSILRGAVRWTLELSTGARIDMSQQMQTQSQSSNLPSTALSAKNTATLTGTSASSLRATPTSSLSSSLLTYEREREIRLRKASFTSAASSLVPGGGSATNANVGGSTLIQQNQTQSNNNNNNSDGIRSSRFITSSSSSSTMNQIGNSTMSGIPQKIGMSNGGSVSLVEQLHSIDRQQHTTPILPQSSSSFSSGSSLSSSQQIGRLSSASLPFSQDVYTGVTPLRTSTSIQPHGFSGNQLSFSTSSNTHTTTVFGSSGSGGVRGPIRALGQPGLSSLTDNSPYNSGGKNVSEQAAALNYGVFGRVVNNTNTSSSIPRMQMSSSMDFSNTFSSQPNSSRDGGGSGRSTNVWTSNPTSSSNSIMPQTYAPGGVGTTRTASSRVRGFSPSPGRIRERSLVVEELTGGDVARKQASLQNQQQNSFSNSSSLHRPRSAQSITSDGQQQRVYGEYVGSGGRNNTSSSSGSSSSFQLRLPSLVQR
jgi:protein-tyrosine phosphatase